MTSYPWDIVTAVAAVVLTGITALRWISDIRSERRVRLDVSYDCGRISISNLGNHEVRNVDIGELADSCPNINLRRHCLPIPILQPGASPFIVRAPVTLGGGGAPTFEILLTGVDHRGKRFEHPCSVSLAGT